MEDAVDWLAYFKSIKGVCPWSLSAALQGRIRITDWHSQILDLGTDLAIVYRCTLNAQQLKTITDQLNLNYEELEFFWSHPSQGGHSTPIPIIIQQDHLHLEKIRILTKNTQST